LVVRLVYFKCGFCCARKGFRRVTSLSCSTCSVFLPSSSANSGTIILLTLKEPISLASTNFDGFVRRISSFSAAVTLVMLNLLGTRELMVLRMGKTSSWGCGFISRTRSFIYYRLYTEKLSEDVSDSSLCLVQFEYMRVAYLALIWESLSFRFNKISAWGPAPHTVFVLGPDLALTTGSVDFSDFSSMKLLL